MKTHIRILSVSALALSISACGFVGSMAEINAQSTATADALEKDLGVKPYIGWHMGNGTLTNVNVTFTDGNVEGMSIGELETHVRAAVAANFKDKPRQLVIAVSIKP
jgi:hypothetical protein